MRVRSLINDCLRWLIGLNLIGLGLLLECLHRIKVRTYLWRQQCLRHRYQIAGDTPVLSYGPELEGHIQSAARRAAHDARFALTSGSTASPKRILYTKKRLRSFKLSYMDVFARCLWALSIRRTSLYLFSSLSRDESLTSLLLEETRLSSYLTTLQAPNRVQCHPAMQALASRYGAAAMRLWILAIANPGLLYSTNPSTLSNFLDTLSSDWQRSSQLIRDFCKNPQRFDSAVHMIARRLASRDSTQRLARIAASDLPLPLSVCAPGVKAYVCWTGGYVKPFLDRLAASLPPERYRLIPLYSMSTETVETVSHFDGESVAFLPMASRVLYEFIEERAEDRPENLRTADHLQVGRSYTMVVSDPYGLRRYRTGDLFLCRGYVKGLPDLSFLGRRGLEYSFTGEKLTSQHVSTVFQKLCGECTWLEAADFLTCIPSHPSHEPVPHYKVILLSGSQERAEISGDALARRCDVLLGQVNREYKSKRESRRLGPIRFIGMPLSDFIDRIGGSGHHHSWESQFKFLPLYRRTWEEFDQWE